MSGRGFETSPSKIKARVVIASSQLLRLIQHKRETENTVQSDKVIVIIKLYAEFSDSLMRRNVIGKSFQAR
jgi:hypothetical protein